MLPPADAAIVARDRALPGLALALDAEALAARLGVGPLRPGYLRYKPGTSCVAALVRERPEAPLHALVAMAYPAERYAIVRARPSWQGGPDPVVFLDAACLAVVPLSRDRRLKLARSLAQADSGDLLREYVGPEAAAARLLRYKPGRRLVLRVDGAEGRPLAVLKVYAGDDFARARAGAAAAAGLGGAPLLGEDAAQGALVTGWIDGTPLCPALAGRAPTPADLVATGAALARLHAAGHRPGAKLDRAAEAVELATVAKDLAPLDPALAARAAPVADAAAAALAALPVAPRPIHGDFSADQIVLRGGDPVVIDWDSSALGDPARDLGTFIARLDAQAVDGLLAPAEAEAAAASLLEGYAAAAGATPPAVAAQHGRALLALAAEGFRARMAGWPERTARLLDRVAAVLPRARRQPALDLGTPALGAALDPDTMAPRLAALLGRPADGAPPGIRLVRHKPGRRALVRYEMPAEGEPEGPAILLGKLRAKGTDRATPALHEALRAAGLDGRPPHRVAVPRSLGALAWPPLWLQEFIPGHTVTDSLRPGGDPTAARRAGAALAVLHATPVPGRTWTMEDELGVLERALAAAAETLPEERACIGAIADGARRLAARLGPADTTGIHRDYYPDQVLTCGGTTWLLDLDLYARGDPAIDVGNFLAHLTELALRRHGDASVLESHAAAFLEEYRAAGGNPVPHRIEAMRRISLARHINISHRIHDRRHVTRPLIALAAALLDTRGPARAFAKAPDPSAVTGSLLEELGPPIHVRRRLCPGC